MSSAPNLLAIETSSDACSVALLKGSILTYNTHIESKMHTQILLSMIDNLLAEANITLHECDGFAFGIGPGSFTGVRIASSVIQGFSLAMHKPVVPVSTLRAIAQAAYRKHQATHVLAVSDAGLQQYYGGLFQSNAEGIMHSVATEFIKTESEIELLLKTRRDTESTLWQRFESLPDAREVAVIAQYEFLLGNTISAAEIEPVYLKAPI